mgnify:CR=1 FL=1|jgi:hypothetical protein
MKPTIYSNDFIQFVTNAFMECSTLIPPFTDSTLAEVKRVFKFEDVNLTFIHRKCKDKTDYQVDFFSNHREWDNDLSQIADWIKGELFLSKGKYHHYAKVKDDIRNLLGMKKTFGLEPHEWITNSFFFRFENFCGVDLNSVGLYIVDNKTSNILLSAKIFNYERLKNVKSINELVEPFFRSFLLIHEDNYLETEIEEFKEVLRENYGIPFPYKEEEVELAEDANSEPDL